MFVFFGGKEKKARATKNNTKSTSKSKEKNTKLWFVDILEKNIENISDNDFLIFHSLGEWEENLKSWLQKHAKVVEYNLSFHISNWLNLTELSENILKKILYTYESAEKNREKWNSNPMLGHAIFGSIKNLEILEKSGVPITDDIVSYFCHEYDGQKIFDFIDAIMEKNYKKSLQMNKNFSENLHYSEVEIFFSSLISLLKKNLYILTLKELGLSQWQIVTHLDGINSYMVGKCLKSKISANELRKIFKNLSDTTLAYRSGKWMKENILWRFLEIDTVLLSLKK